MEHSAKKRPARLSLKLLRGGNLLLSGLVAGSFATTMLLYNPVFDQMNASDYTQYQSQHLSLGSNVMPFVLLLTLVSYVPLGLLTRREWREWPFLLTMVALVLMLSAVVVTVAGEVPINLAFLDPSSPPANWSELRDRWTWNHNIRTGLALMAFLGAIAAALSKGGSASQ